MIAVSRAYTAYECVKKIDWKRCIFCLFIEKLEFGINFFLYNSKKTQKNKKHNQQNMRCNTYGDKFYRLMDAMSKRHVFDEIFRYFMCFKM